MPQCHFDWLSCFFIRSTINSNYPPPTTPPPQSELHMNIHPCPIHPTRERNPDRLSHKKQSVWSRKTNTFERRCCYDHFPLKENISLLWKINTLALSNRNLPFIIMLLDLFSLGWGRGGGCAGPAKPGQLAPVMTHSPHVAYSPSLMAHSISFRLT